jgi:tetratricopeptide (TPR) repeat protein
MKKSASIRSHVHNFRSQMSARRSPVLAAAALAAIGVIAACSPAAFAQQRVGGDGRILDANNRVGSGGFNDSSSSALPPGTFGNALVTGNVTGGEGFQGNIPYFAPGAFHGTLPSTLVDNFVSQSTNVQTNGTIVDNAQNVHLFLGDSRGVNPPAGFVSTGAQSGYIPAAPLSDTTAFTSDTRLGSAAPSPVSTFVPSAIYATGGTQAGGGQSAYTSASPLLGVKTLQSAQQTDGTGNFTNTAAGTGPLSSAIGSGDRVDLSANLQTASLSSSSDMNSALSPTSLSGLPPGVASYATPNASGSASNSPGSGATPGSQLPGAPAGSTNASAANNAAANSALGTGSLANGSNTSNGVTPNGVNTNLNGPINASINSQVNAAVPSGLPMASTIGGSRLSGGINTGELDSVNIYSPTSNQPTSAYQRMLLRFKTINPNAPLTQEQQNLLNQAKFQDIKTAANNGSKGNGSRGSQPLNTRSGSELPAAGAGSPGALPPGSIGNSNAQPGGINSGGLNTGGPAGSLPGNVPSPTALPAGPVVPQQVAPVEGGKPVVLDSFSKDEASPQVKEHLAKAEALMKEGRFTSALEEYDQVEQLAPTDPYTELGRANAELGASYYGQAEAHLRQAFLSDEALLSAQLDLKSFLGEDKLQYLVNDLKQIAQNDPTNPRPVFLLSYICYNTNNPRGAAAYLDLAQKREGKPDPFFDLLRKHWDLPDTSDQGGDLNK